MRDITLGQYYPADSFTHKLDPRVKLVLVVAFIVTVFLVKNLIAYAAVILCVVSGTLISRIPISKVLKSIKTIIFLVIFTAALNLLFYKGDTVLWSWWRINISLEGIFFSLKMALRLILLVMGTTLLTYTTTPTGLTDGMESLMYPLKLIKVPTHDIAVIMSIALRFIPILSEEVDKIMMAQKARGASFDSGGIVKRAKALLPVLIPLFVSAFRRADELALALDARCYNATPNRTRYQVMRPTYRDLVAVVGMAVFMVLVIALNLNFWGAYIPPENLWWLFS